jgi:diguanylate cyclase (GGDEF)-like protein
MLFAMVTARRTPTRHFDPVSGTWPMIALDVVWVLLVSVTSFGVAGAIVGGSWSPVAQVVVAAVALFVLTALPMRHCLLRQRREVEEREELLGNESARRSCESRLVRALDMAVDEPAALAVVVSAVGALSPTIGVEVLLADSSKAHLTQAARSEREGAPSVGCDVGTPRSCPAVRQGHALRFDDSEEFDACPHLRRRSGAAVSAVCIPISVMGSSVGVVHAVRPCDESFAEPEIAGLSAVTQHLGARIGLLTAMRQSQLQANTDPLTGLLNRRSLEHEVRALMHDDRAFALVLADLDNFKVLNDTHGHDAGDRALRIFARILRDTLRNGDLLCRYGGEEFLVVLPGLTADEAASAFDRVRLELDTAAAGGQVPLFTVSAGVVDTDDGATLSELVTIADRCLMRAKADGRNRIVTGLSS